MTLAARTSGNTSTTLGARVVAAVAAAAVAVAGSTLYAAAPAYAAADSVRDRSWHLTQLRVSEAHRTSQGEGITVAVVDTGVDATHPDLTGNVLTGVDVMDPTNQHRGQRDTVGHGTAMASLIAGHGHGPGGRDGVLGIAPKARILPLNVYDAKAKGAPDGALARAIRLAVDQGAGVVCVALGGSFEPAEAEAVRYANARNVLVVAGVGNPPAVLVASPANTPEAVAVTGVDRAGKTITTVEGVIGAEIDIAAPGGDIISARPGGRYDTATGTSNATAIIAGALALIRARYPKADRNEQLRRLVWTTTDVGNPGKDFVYGWGALNLVDALTAEPREPAGAAPAPTQGSPQQARAAPGQPEDSTGRGTLIMLAGAVLCLALVGLAVVVLLRALRRRATTARAVDAGAVDAGAVDAGAVDAQAMD